MLQVVQDTMPTGVGYEDLQRDRGKQGECGGETGRYNKEEVTKGTH